MKSLFVVAAAFACLPVLAQKNISINHSINDDGKTMSFKIKGEANGKPIDYNRTFDVSAMSKEERKALQERVYDSLGLPSPVAPRVPLAPHAPLQLHAPVAPMVPIAPIAPESPEMVMLAEPGSPVIASRNDFNEFYSVGGDHPFTKEIKYNPKNGLLYMKYRFIKKGEEVTLEKSVDAKEKSKEERDQIIKKYEKEIGLAQPEMI